MPFVLTPQEHFISSSVILLFLRCLVIVFLCCVWNIVVNFLFELCFCYGVLVSYRLLMSSENGGKCYPRKANYTSHQHKHTICAVMSEDTSTNEDINVLKSNEGIKHIL